jgi:hypothetical protein
VHDRLPSQATVALKCFRSRRNGHRG